MARAFVLVLACSSLWRGAAVAAEEPGDLARKVANPVSSLISVPFQFNYDCCFGSNRGGRVTLNVQPVAPFALSADLTLIIRTIVPIVDQLEPVKGAGAHFGIADTTQSFFLVPAASGGWTWAIGPVFFWPTATDATLGSHKWGAGPTALVLRQEHGWTYGMLFNHIWSYGGEPSAPDISNSFLQPFVSYTWPDTTSLTLNTESTYDWERKQWTVPVNLTLGHIVRLGTQALSLQGGARIYAAAPHDTATWGLRATISLLFPN